MGKIKVESLIGKGITARVINAGKLYSTYKDFATAAGYSDAVVDVWTDEESRKGERAENLVGSIVTVLAKGNHEDRSYTIYVVEDDECERYLFGEKGLEIIEATENKRPSYDEALALAEKALADLRTAAYAEGYAQGKFDAEIEKAHGKPSLDTEAITPVKSPQQTRDEIVERAKKDVSKRIDNIGMTPNKWGDDRIVKFIVNKEKRTVVCLLLGYLSRTPYEKGIAKCAPNDCFNVHIGKAIALRRALGLDVPSEYYNAPKPTEVRVGDRIKLTDAGEWTGDIETVKGFNHRGNALTNESPGCLDRSHYEIVDDSRE